ncbi:hypothetical protein EDD22DRAFT_953187 [Suillus occidentalis]|nr:hypothetical protein EDD22DRAFT_953187 [Suillus occidentalis]
MFPPYPPSTSPIPGVPSSHRSPPGQAHQTIPQPTRQYYTTMSPPSYSPVTASMPGIGQACQTIQQPAEQYYTISMEPLSAVNMVSQSSMISPDHELTVSGCPNHHHHSTSLKSTTTFSSKRTSRTMISHLSQIGFPDSSTSTNLGDRSFAPLSRTHIVNSPNGNTATRPFVFADDLSSHVANMSIQATIDSGVISHGSEAASAHFSSTYNHHTQLNGAMIDNAARSRFPTAESVPLTRNSVPMVSRNTPGPQSTSMHPSAINMNQYTGHSSHNPTGLHSSQYRTTVTGSNFSPSGSLQMPHLPQHTLNTDLAPPNSYPKSFTRDFGTQHGSQPAGPPYQQASSMAPSPSTHLQQDLTHRNHSRPNSEHRCRTYAQETHPSPSISFFCDWLNEDDTLCTFQGSLDDLKNHFTSSHLSGAQSALGRCLWQGCLNGNDMRRDSTWRHVRETHLRIKRGT